MNLQKTAALLAMVLVLGLPIMSEAGIFANITGTAKSMTVQLTTVSFGGRLSKTTAVYSAGDDSGSIFSDAASNFWQFTDTVAFSNAQLSITGSLLSPAPGTNASGPAEFRFITPVNQPRDGTQITVQGAANVQVSVNVSSNKATVKALNFIPSSVRVESFKNNTSFNVSFGSASIKLPAMQKSLLP